MHILKSARHPKGLPHLQTVSRGISFLTTLMQPITLALSILVPRLTVLFWTPARLCNSIRYKHPRLRPHTPDFYFFTFFVSFFSSDEKLSSDCPWRIWDVVWIMEMEPALCTTLSISRTNYILTAMYLWTGRCSWEKHWIELKTMCIMKC